MTLFELVRVYERACCAEREALAARVLDQTPYGVNAHMTALRERVKIERELYAAANDPIDAMKFTLAASVMLRCIKQRACHRLDCPRGKHCNCGIAEALQAAKDLGLHPVEAELL